MVDGGDHLAEGDGPRRRELAQAVGAADDLAGPHAATGQQGTAHLRPVVAAGAVVDARRAAELAPDDDGRVVEHAAHVEVLDQGAEALVELAAVIADEVEVLAVAVPAAVA